MFAPYTPETFPDNIKFVKDTTENRKAIRGLLGEYKYSLSNSAYIKINLETKEWIGTPNL